MCTPPCRLIGLIEMKRIGPILFFRDRPVVCRFIQRLLPGALLFFPIPHNEILSHGRLSGALGVGTGWMQKTWKWINFEISLTQYRWSSWKKCTFSKRRTDLIKLLGILHASEHHNRSNCGSIQSSDWDSIDSVIPVYSVKEATVPRSAHGNQLLACVGREC